MLSLAERQDAFARAILDAALPVPASLAGPAGSVREERFAVYRNNAAVSLVEALRAAFPVVDRLVGAEFFTAMARAHAVERPPRSPVLLHYGRDFPAFIARFEPAEVLPYLADVARLEWLWLEAYHSPDAEPVVPEALERLQPEHLVDLRIVLHPATRLARFDFPVLAIWRAHQGSDEPAECQLGAVPDHVLIVRPEATVSVIGLTSGAFAFLQIIEARGSLAEAASAALAVEPALDLAELLSLLFTAGAFARFDFSGDGTCSEGKYGNG